MINSLLFMAVVLIWGSSWIMVRYQVGVVPVEASIAYRMGSAALIMFAWAALRHSSRPIKPREHVFLALQGALIFSTNFFLFYRAAGFITTGLIAVVFSTASAMTICIKSLFMAYRPSLRVTIGSLLGMGGIGILFWPQITGIHAQPNAISGLMLSIGGTLCFSCGGIVTARNQRHDLAHHGHTALAMGYGALLLCAFAIGSGQGFDFDPRMPYVGSLLYLSLVASVIGFACYFALLRRIQPERAAYATVLFPIVALGLSTLFEQYQWHFTAFAGVALTLAGNVLVLRQPKKQKIARQRHYRQPENENQV